MREKNKIKSERKTKKLLDFIISSLHSPQVRFLDFIISSLHSPQVRFLDFKINIVLYFTISPIYRIGRFRYI